MEIANARGRRPRYLLVFMMLMLLVVVLFSAFSILPLGPIGGLTNRQARKQMAEAQRWENQSLPLTAAEIYQQITNNPRVEARLRAQAAIRLADLYRDTPDHQQAAQAALEKAYYLSPAGPERDTLRRDLEIMRGRPVIQQPPVAHARPQPADVFIPLPKTAQVIARVGDETVTMDDILYAWSQFNGAQSPTPQQLEPFTRSFLDMVMLADEARRRGLDVQPRVALDLRVRRVLDLNQALTQQLIGGLSAPSLDTLRQYYQAHASAFGKPATATLGVITVSDPEDAEALEAALGKGMDFKAAAKKFSPIANTLKNGIVAGRVSDGDRDIPAIGPVPGLSARLVAYEDGVTTGPIQTSSGTHWIKILDKSAAQLQPFETVRDAVMLDYQKHQLAVQRENLLAQLHQVRPVELFGDRVTTEPVARAQAATTPTQAAQIPPSAAPTPASTAVPGRAAAVPSQPEPEGQTADEPEKK